MPLSKNKTKLIRSLALKKNRDESGMFVAEGRKTVETLWGYFDCQLLAATQCYLDSHGLAVSENICEASEEELSKASSLKSSREAIAVFRKKPEQDESKLLEFAKKDICMVLDGIQDPGNLGTIVRIADWFGILQIACSEDCADIYSPKAIQATMGAFSRVCVNYCNLEKLLSSVAGVPIYGTMLDGDDLYSTELQQNGFVVMGSEGHGISQKISELINLKLRIPSYPEGKATSESLNVAMATAIVCAELRRRAKQKHSL